jgi:ribonuclease BN (tRNA processing enzyme)
MPENMTDANLSEYRLTCFGTGDGCPCADRHHAAFLYRLGKDSILIDCGESTDRSYKASGLSYDLIDGIFISHLHADHFGGFFMLMQGFWLEQRQKDLPVHLPGGAVEPIGQMLQAAMLFPEELSFRFQLRPISPRVVIPVGQVQVRAFPTTHLDRMREKHSGKYPVGFETYCFLLESGDRRVGHSADLGKPEDLEPLVTKPLDLLVCELAHFQPEEVFRYLQGRDIKRVVWVHLGRPQREKLASIRSLATKMLPGMKHTFAADGQEIDF